MRDGISSRDLVKRCLERRSVERLPVVLHFGPYAARLQQTSYQQMCGDATLLANSMQSAQRLFDCDGLIMSADPTVEAEACGCRIEWRDDEPTVASHPLAGSIDPADGFELPGVGERGRVAVALESARRLVAVIGRDVALIPAVTGPVTVASHLRGPAFWADLDEAPEHAYKVLDKAGHVVLSLVRRYLDMEIGQLILSDPLLGRVDPAHYPAIASVLRPLWNVAEFYDAPILLRTEVDGVNVLEQLAGIGAAGLLVEGDVSISAAGAGFGAFKSVLGLGVPQHFLEGKEPGWERELAAWRAESLPPGCLALCFTIPRTTPPESLHAVVRLLRET